MSRQWSFLKKGDLIDLVAPGSACTKEELEASLEVLESLGYRARVPKNLFSGHPILANTDAIRFEHFQHAIQAPDSKAIWCVRGGYGSIRLLPFLKKLKMPALTKVILGYSDITTLHHFVFTRWRWPSLHSSLFDRIGSDKMTPQARKDLFALLEGKTKAVTFKGLKPLNEAAQKSRTIAAPIVGGNLCVLNSTLGTEFQFKASGQFLFLEDKGERPHRVDRMLEQMSQAGVFKNCRGILLGDFILDSVDKDLLWSDVINRFANNTSIPVLKGLPVGHGSIQKTLPLGTKAILKLGSRSAGLQVLTGGR